MNLALENLSCGEKSSKFVMTGIQECLPVVFVEARTRKKQRLVSGEGLLSWLSSNGSVCLQCSRHRRRRFDPCEDPLEEGMTTHSSILACRTPMDRSAAKLRSESDLAQGKSGEET